MKNLIEEIRDLAGVKELNELAAANIANYLASGPTGDAKIKQILANPKVYLGDSGVTDSAGKKMTEQEFLQFLYQSGKGIDQGRVKNILTILKTAGAIA